MFRITVELVPYGLESMARTISEVCITETIGDEDTVAYETAGYVVKTDNKIQEFASTTEPQPRDTELQKLLGIILSSETCEVGKVKLAEYLLGKTRLAGEIE